LFTPQDEQAFVDGCMAIIHGQDLEALSHLRKATQLADGAFLAGLTALKLDHDEEAEKYLRSAASKRCALTRYFSKYGLAVSVKLSVIDEVATEVEPDLRGVLLALIRTCAKQANWHEALAHSKELYRLEPHDPWAKLALADALMKAGTESRESFTQAIELTEDIENDSAVAAALLLERARALRWTRRHGEAREVLTGLLFCKQNRTTEFMDAVRHEGDLLEERMDRL
jgi:tetratricopeptide (TPR) repeat protein